MILGVAIKKKSTLSDANRAPSDKKSSTLERESGTEKNNKLALREIYLFLIDRDLL